MRPLIADGGSLTVLRRLASFAWGEWRVEWPESVPDEQRPKIDDDREFGYVYDMPRQVGRMGRRFVRSDVSITAADYGPDGVALPFSGFSDVEQALDEAAGRTDGDTFFEREIDRGGLNGLVPFEDFGVGDSVDVGVWSVVLPSQVVAEVQEITEPGVGVVDWRVRVSGDLVPDDVGRKRQNLELERQVWQERRERIRSVDAERSARTSEIATERRARVSGDKSLSDRIDRLPTSEVLNAEIEGLNSKIGGLNTDLTLLRQTEINEIQRVINDKQTGINALNDRFRAEQLKVNALNDEFRVESIERDTQYVELLGKHSEALSKSEAALSTEEKYRLRMASGQASGGEVIPNDNPYFYIEHTGRGGSTGVWLTGVPCDGSITVMHRTNGGYTDMWALDVKRGQFTNSGATVGGVGKFHYLWTGVGQKVVTWMVLYQLWPSDS